MLNNTSENELIECSKIKNIHLANRFPNFEGYIAEFFSLFNDINSNFSFIGDLVITYNNKEFTFSPSWSAFIPEHAVANKFYLIPCNTKALSIYNDKDVAFDSLEAFILML